MSMMDLLNKFKATWNPKEILDDYISGENRQLLDEAPISDGQILAQKLCDHLNQIKDFNDRIESLDYLSSQALSNFDNLSYSTDDQSLCNAIISVGGKDNTVDFELIKNVINIMFEWYNLTAANSITADIKGEI